MIIKMSYFFPFRRAERPHPIKKMSVNQEAKFVWTCCIFFIAVSAGRKFFLRFHKSKQLFSSMSANLTACPTMWKSLLSSKRFHFKGSVLQELSPILVLSMIN